MQQLKKLIEKFFPFLFVFIASIFRPWDPDLGWHLKYGEYFFKYHTLLRENIFSQMMPNYKWPDTDWGVDVISYFVFHYLGGFFGLTILGAIVVTLTFLFFSKAFKLDYFQKSLIFPFIVYIETPINEVSFRGQQVSVLMLGILFYLIEQFSQKNNKQMYLIIPVFWLWANLNGQFILGLALFAIWIFIHLTVLFFRKSENLKKEFIKLLSIFLGSLALTLINPFGFDIYKVTLSHFGSVYLKDIGEYLPFKQSSAPWWNQLVIGILIGTGFVFMYFKGDLKKKIPMFSILGILYFLSWTVRRYAWSFYYLAIPFLKPIADFVKPNKEKQIFWSSTIIFTILIIIVAIFKYPYSQYLNMNWDTYCYELAQCSPKAAEFIVNNNLNNDKLLTAYDYGGWLIWNYREIKPTIDGRMHLWIDENGYSGFGDYYGYEQNYKSIQNSKYTSVYVPTSKPLYNELVQLSNEGKWKLVFTDNGAGLFVRVTNP